jgi:hypothetical protein
VPVVEQVVGVKDRGVTYQQLTPEQAKRIRAIITRHSRYLGKLLARMDQLRFPPDDPFRQSTKATADATNAIDFLLGRIEDGSALASSDVAR